MLKKLIALSVVFGLIVAEPIPKMTDLAFDDLGFSVLSKPTKIAVPESKTFDVAINGDSISFVLDLLPSLIGYKISALSVAVSIIKWLVSNSVYLVFGAIATLGFCKLTGKCSLDYKNVIPLAQLQDFVTPETLESAEQLLVQALKLYAQEKK